MAGVFRFTFGPWNIDQGADPFGPPVRASLDFHKKLSMYKELGFDGVQFHDDDAVPNMNDYSASEIIAKAKDIKRSLDDHGLTADRMRLFVPEPRAYRRLLSEYSFPSNHSLNIIVTESKTLIKISFEPRSKTDLGQNILTRLYVDVILLSKNCKKNEACDSRGKEY